MPPQGFPGFVNPIFLKNLKLFAIFIFRFYGAWGSLGQRLGRVSEKGEPIPVSPAGPLGGLRYHQLWYPSELAG